MNAIVTARVPVEIKEQVAGILESMGSSPTELINTAYEYVLEKKQLPVPTADVPLEGHRGEHRSLTAEQKRKLASDLRTMTLGPIDGYDGTNFKELLNAVRDERYANHA